MRKPHAASHLPARYPYSSSLCCTNKAGQAVWVWGRAQGWTWRHPDSIRSLSILRLWKFFLLTCFVPLCLEKSIGLMEGASKSHPTLPYLPLPPSTASQDKSVPNICNKTLLTLLQPTILLLFRCCDKGSNCRWPFQLGREGTEKAVRKKHEPGSAEWRRSSTPSTSAEWKPNRRQQIPALQGPAWKQENFLSPLSICHVHE